MDFIENSAARRERKKIVKDPARRKADMIVAAAREHKAFDFVLLKVGRITTIADFFFICSCRSTRQVQAIAEHITEQLKKMGKHIPLGVEGKTQGHWVLMDYGDVIVHIFHDQTRDFYDLESLWHEAEHVDLGPERGRSDDSGSDDLDLPPEI